MGHDDVFEQAGAAVIIMFSWFSFKPRGKYYHDYDNTNGLGNNVAWFYRVAAYARRLNDPKLPVFSSAKVQR